MGDCTLLSTLGWGPQVLAPESCVGLQGVGGGTGLRARRRRQASEAGRQAIATAVCASAGKPPGHACWGCRLLGRTPHVQLQHNTTAPGYTESGGRHSELAPAPPSPRTSPEPPQSTVQTSFNSSKFHMSPQPHPRCSRHPRSTAKPDPLSPSSPSDMWCFPWPHLGDRQDPPALHNHLTPRSPPTPATGPPRGPINPYAETRFKLPSHLV